ncbi:MAG: hypothetical protein ACRD1A_08620, partial [Terriglobales bacterium]
MSDEELEKLRYPVGRFDWEHGGAGKGRRADWLRVMADTPGELRRAVSGLDGGQLDTCYRPGGWTVRQVVHHYA